MINLATVRATGSKPRVHGNGLADAWIEERHNAGYSSHTNFEYRLIDEQPAPYMLMEVPY